MSEANAAQATDNSAATATSSAAIGSYLDEIGLGSDDDTEVEQRPAPAAARPAVKAAPVEDDLSDLDDASKPWTPERAADVRSRLEAARNRAREETRKANAASARARAQEERFSRTKSTVLETKQQVAARESILTAATQALRSGDKESVLKAIGYLTGQDPLEAWTEISQAVAGGKIQRAQRDPELIGHLTQLQQLVQQQQLQLAELAAQGPTREREQAIEHHRELLVTAAGDAVDFPLTAHFAKSEQTRGVIKSQLAEIKEQEYARRGTAIDNETAFGILEGRLRSQSELYQQVHAPQRQATDNRGTAGPAPGEQVAARQIAAPQAPSPPIRTIPAELAARSGGTRRAMSEAERVAEIARSTPASFFRDIGLGGLLFDGEE
jgi:hypothetical protein